MSLTNSFHSSAKKHAISTSGKLARVALHNSRGYYSHHYDQSKIHSLIGDATELAGDVRKYINDTFAGSIDAYNAKQKRQDRRIKTGAFDHFEANKSLDIANEVIYQIGDQEFWSRHRTDTAIQTRNGERILKSYPEQVKDVMDEIFRKQMAAYEQIYTTDGDVILFRILADKEAAEAQIAAIPEDVLQQYQEIRKEKNASKRNQKIKDLPDPDAYLEYSEAAEKLAMIDKLKLIDRIKNKQMHIHIVNGTAHYDEFSPHAHAISVCWAEGYSTGLDSRVAKSVVLNQWSLSVIQDKMREIAADEMEKHPEIFQGEILAEKQRGRNLDYSAEQIARQKQQELLQRNQELLQSNQELLQSIQEAEQIKQEISQEAMQRLVEVRDLRSEVATLQDDKNLIQTYEEYDYEVTDVDQKIDAWSDELGEILQVAQDEQAPAPVVEQMMRGVVNIMDDAAVALRRRIDRIGIFEQIHDVLYPNSERLRSNLDDLIDRASPARPGLTVQNRKDLQAFRTVYRKLNNLRGEMNEAFKRLRDEAQRRDLTRSMLSEHKGLLGLFLRLLDLLEEAVQESIREQIQFLQIKKALLEKELLEQQPYDNRPVKVVFDGSVSTLANDYLDATLDVTRVLSRELEKARLLPHEAGREIPQQASDPGDR